MKGKQVNRFAAVNSRESSKGLCSSVMFLAWCLIMIWILFLVYCYQFGLLDQGKIVAEVEKDIEIVDQTLKRIKVGSIPVVYTPTTMTEVKAEPIEPIRTEPIVAKPVSHADHSEPDADIHIIFSTDCSPYQDWQTLTLFHSAKVVGQPGKVTRIASGCDDEKKAKLVALYAKLYGTKYGVHFTPDFKKDEKTGKGYDFYNKPWGLKHWLDHSEPPIPNDMVVALLDPDMIFVRPITTKIKGNNNNLHSNQVKDDELPDKIGKGHPVAQTYGLGAPWTNDNHKKFNRGYICGEGSPCLKPNDRFGSEHYSVGPPYIVQKEDLTRLAETWTKFVPRVYEGYPYLLAEMYAYSMAAAHEELPHLQLWNYMVSNVDAGDEGWALVDQLDEVCVPPVNGIYYPDEPLPNVVHFCQTFRAGDLGFMKRRVPHDLFTCEHAMLMTPPTDLGKADYVIKDGEKVNKNQRSVKRNAYVVCVVYDAINSALEEFKKVMCADNPKTNFEKTVNINNL